MPDRRLLDAFMIAVGATLGAVGLGLLGFLVAWIINAGF